MPPFHADRLKVRVKQHLRDVRFVLRGMRPPSPAEVGMERRDGGHVPERQILKFTRKISDISDSALQTLEAVAIGMLSSDPQSHFGEARAYPLDRYKDAGSGGATLFARDSYFAAKQIMHMKGVTNPLISEELFAAAYRSAVGQWTDNSAAVEQGRRPDLEATSRATAILAMSILEKRAVQAPARFDTPPGRDGAIEAGVYVSCAIGLAITVAGYHRELLAADDSIYGGVCAALDARYSMFERTWGAPDPTSALAHAYAELAPHLP
jgi:hypothetical protein